MIPAGAVVIISHNHHDHLDEASVRALGTGHFSGPLSLGGLVCGVAETTVDGRRFTCLPIQHWSRHLGQDYNESLWCT